MSVVQFSADSWQASSPGLMKGLGTRVEALREVAQGLERWAGSGQISGVGADAMRSYIREVHVPLVQSLLVGLFTFQTAIGKYWDGYSQVDTDGNFRLVDDEFDAHLTQLEEGVGRLQGFASDLRSISASAAHVVALSGAGAGAVDRAVEQFERMRLIAKVQQETWEAYESSDPGFVQVQQLIAEVNNIVSNVGTLTVGQGRTYTSGSFDLSLGVLGVLTSGMVEYCQTNQEVAAAGWENLFSGYSDDVEAEAERQRREDAQWGMLWDGLQILGGAVVTVIGLGLTPFTAGASLGLTVLGASLVVGGVNNMINHASIATTGNELNFIGMATDQIAGWYDVNVAQPAIASGSPALQLLAGVGSGVGQVISDAAQLNVADIVTGVSSLITDQNARDQLWEQIAGAGAKVLSGDFYLAGQIVGNLLPLGAVVKLGKLNLLNKVDDLSVFKPQRLSLPGETTSALDWMKRQLGVDGPTAPPLRIPDASKKPELLGPNASNRDKGIFGEAMSDWFFTEVMDYKRVDKLSDVNANGIDAIYQTADGRYVIVEAKFSTTGNPRLGNTLDGPQMGDQWLIGSENTIQRILNAVHGNEKLADEIIAALKDGNVDKYLMTVRPDGTFSPTRIP